MEQSMSRRDTSSLALYAMDIADSMQVQRRILTVILRHLLPFIVKAFRHLYSLCTLTSSRALRDSR